MGADYCCSPNTDIFGSFAGRGKALYWLYLWRYGLRQGHGVDCFRTSRVLDALVVATAAPDDPVQPVEPGQPDDPVQLFNLG